MSYQTAFPDFTLDVAIPDGFRDDSYCNDTMPRFTKELPHGQTLTIWVDYADRTLSEYPEESRFLAEVISFDGEYAETLPTDNWQAILDFIAEY